MVEANGKLGGELLLPQLTVITPIAPEHVEVAKDAQASVAAQTLPVAHLCMVDQERKGPGFIRNHLLGQVQTPYVAFLDADDWLEPNFAERGLAAIEPGRYVYTDWFQGERHVKAPERAWCQGTYHLVTAIVPTDLARLVNGFDESLPGMEDTDFFLKLVTRGVCGIRVPEALVHYAVGGGRSKNIHHTGDVQKLRHEINKRYGGQRLYCCGGYVVQEPIGEKQHGDVLALALWAGNREERGRQSGRRYPRMSYPKTTWLLQEDVNASPELWQTVPEQADRQVELEEKRLYGIDVLEEVFMQAGILRDAPPPALARSPVSDTPNFARVRRLGRKGVQLPVFVMPRTEYPSYADFWKLVKLSGFEVCYGDSLYLGSSTNTYIFVTPEGIPDCSEAQARIIFWQFEYAGDYTDQSNKDTVDELWSSDPTHAKAHGARYVLLGSHPGLAEGSDSVNGSYDVAMLAYMTPRRVVVKEKLADLRWPEDYPGHDSERRHEVLKGSRLMLHIHQHDEPATAPIRYALAAAYKLPVIAETVPDSGPYKDAITFRSYSHITRAVTSGKVSGKKLHKLLCIDNLFEECVMRGLDSTSDALEYVGLATEGGNIPDAVNSIADGINAKVQMKIIAFTRLHYGADYLAEVIKSTEGFAERHIVLYTPVANFPGKTNLPCPDERQQLMDIARQAGGPRVEWVEGMPIGAQSAMEICPDADLLLELDGDEIIQPALFKDILRRYKAGELTNRHYRLPMLHHWRSFNYVCRDQLRPVRIYLPQIQENGDALYYPEGAGYIHHFGYARNLVDTRYKLALSMHADEFRTGWWDEVFMDFPARKKDLHPVVVDIWNAEPYDRHSLPEFMHNHEYFDLEVIE